MRQRVALVDGHGVRDAVAGVHHDAGGAARRVQREHGLDGDVHGRDVEGLEHDLGHLLAVGLRVERGLGEQDRVLLGRDAQLVVEGVVPDLLHVVPVGHDAVLDRVLEREDATLGLGLVTDVRVLLAHAHHHAGLARAADDRGEDRAGRVIAREAGLAHAGAVVHHESRDLVISHCLVVSCESVFDLCRGGGAARQPKERGGARARGAGFGGVCGMPLGRECGVFTPVRCEVSDTNLLFLTGPLTKHDGAQELPCARSGPAVATGEHTSFGLPYLVH